MMVTHPQIVLSDCRDKLRKGDEGSRIVSFRQASLDLVVEVFIARGARENLVLPGRLKSRVRISHDGEAEKVRRVQNIFLRSIVEIQ